METIKNLQRKFQIELHRIKCFEEYSEYNSCTQGNKLLYGRHINVGLSIDQPDQDIQKQIVQLFRKYYHSRSRRLHHKRGVGYQWNAKVKSELVILI